jgi:hypothetical protein
METTKPFASLSLDLDDQWAYMKTHGDEGWESFPSYLNVVVPRVLKFLEERQLKITFFVVGQDAALPSNHAVLRSLATAGHEIGNHSFHHEPWLHLYSHEELEADFVQAEEALEKATGQRPMGFRGPGFSISYEVMASLARRGYVYDASTFPTYLGPFARAYYFMTAKLTAEEKEQRKGLFGTFRDGLRTNRTYVWRKDGHELVEIPVTTMPVFKLPIHISYIVYLSMFSSKLAQFYMNTALSMCASSGIEPSLLLHPLDFLGGDDNIPELNFFPGMRMNSEKKIKIVSDTLQLLAEKFTVVPMKQHALAIGQRSTFPVLGLR